MQIENVEFRSRSNGVRVCRSQPVEAVVVEFNPEQDLHLLRRNWRSNIDRAGKLFGNLTQEQLLQKVAPGKNRLIYLWGHLTANDALIPLLGFGARIHPEMDLMFVSNPDRTVPTILLGENLNMIWQQTSEILWTSFTKMSIADWLPKHSAVSEEDFLREPYRNRFTVLIGRTAHIAYHFGQAKLWERVQT